MMGKVSVNVVIPVYNTDQYLEKCLSSLVNQIFTDWHAVIVNDGSTDHSHEIGKRYSEKYPDKFEYCNKLHGGPGSARNYGVKHSKSEAVAWYFLDSDDHLEPDGLEIMFNRMKSDNSDMVACGYTRHKGKEGTDFFYKTDMNVIDQREFFASVLDNDNIGCYVGNKLFSNRLLPALHFPERRLFEDIVMVYNAVLMCERISIVPKPLYNYICRAGSITTALDLKHLSDLERAVSERNNVIEAKFPDLCDQCAVNKLRTDIYVLNQICKNREAFAEKKYSEYLSLIGKQRKYYPDLDLRHKIMAYLIRYFPKLYLNTIAML